MADSTPHDSVEERQWVFLLMMPAVVLTFLLGPILRHFDHDGLSFALVIAFSVCVFLGMWAHSPKRRHLAYGAVLLSINVVGLALGAILDTDPQTVLAFSIYSLVPLVALSFALQLGSLITATRVTPAHLSSAVFAYVLLGWLWAVVYLLVWGTTKDGTAFEGIATLAEFSASHAEGSETLAVAVHDEVLSPLLYFSFVTITTLGYGDITPLGDLAPSLAAMEALVGQLFLAIFIAHLVSLNVARRMSKK